MPNNLSGGRKHSGFCNCDTVTVTDMYVLCRSLALEMCFSVTSVGMK